MRGLHRDSARRLDLCSRSCASAAGKSFRRSVARGIRTGGEERGGIRCRGDLVLRTFDPAWIARSRRPHRMVRAAELPGARCGHGAQPGIDRAAICRHGCRRDTCSARSIAQSRPWASGCLRAWLLRPSLDLGRDQRTARCGRGGREGHRRARGVAHALSMACSTWNDC